MKYWSQLIIGISVIFSIGGYHYRFKNIEKRVNARVPSKPTLEDFEEIKKQLLMTNQKVKEHDAKIDNIQIEQARIFTSLEYIEKMTDKIDTKIDKLNSKDK